MTQTITGVQVNSGVARTGKRERGSWVGEEGIPTNYKEKQHPGFVFLYIICTHPLSNYSKGIEDLPQTRSF